MKQLEEEKASGAQSLGAADPHSKEYKADRTDVRGSEVEPVRGSEVEPVRGSEVEPDPSRRPRQITISAADMTSTRSVEAMLSDPQAMASGSTSMVHLEAERKFWEISLAGPTTTVTFGKVGTSGQSKEHQHACDEKAERFYYKMIEDKRGKGYA